jgi:hypothetical protein
MAVVAVNPSSTGAHTYFFSDDSVPHLRGDFDVTCGTSGTQNVAVATSGEKLGVLLSDSTSAQLYICEMPTLPH